MSRTKRLLQRNRWDTESGFTLIELLVVILIIGILAAIAIPMFLNQRKSAVDASIKSDIRNVATSYKTWRVNPSNDNVAFRAAVGGIAIVAGPAGWSVSGTGLPEIGTSEGNTVEVVVVPHANWNTTWPRAHEEGEFCLVGRGDGGNYNYPGGNAAWYDRSLYYDSMLGGLKTMQELSDAIDDGKTVSCYGYANRWKATTGN